MIVDRPHFLSLASASALPCALPSLPSDATAHAMARLGIKAMAFDGLAIFDPRPIAALAESLFPGNGSALMIAWRARQLDYHGPSGLA